MRAETTPLPDGARGIVLLCLLAVLSAILPAFAAPASASGRYASMVIDANTGQVLHQHAADEPRYPASLTKMMTLYIVFELMEQGRLSPETRIRVSDEAARTSPSKLGLKAGADIALLDAVKALIVKSANDMAVAIAEHVAGSEEKFAALMTRKARQIGMAATTFRNPHGLPDPAQVTTARDMLTLAMRLNDDFPRQYKLFSSRTFSYGGAIYRNHNTMLGYYDGMDGLKTGYTRASGFNIVTSVRRNGRHIVGAVFGGSSASARNVYMRAILDRGIAVASTERTRKPVLIARNDGRSRQAAIVGQGGWEPKLVEAPRPAPVPQPRQRPVAADARSPEPQPTTAPQQGTRIEIARVRPVVVAPRQPRATNPPEPAAMRDQAPAAKEPDRPAPGVEQKPTPARTFAAPVVEAATGKVARGSPPSTLQAQAERLNSEAGDRPAPFTGQRVASSAAGLRGVPAPVSAGGGVILQVGAYPSEPEAQRGIAAARTSSSMLGNAASRAEPVTAGGRQLWRARFVGLDEKTAATACNELRRRKIDCLVSRGQ